MRRSCAAGRWALAWKLLAPATLCPLPVGTRHMNLKFLETFVWVARLKSFRLTAEKLFSTQASISSRIAVLEDELGVKLFVRDSRGVTLTPEGDKVLAYAERMMDTMHALKQSLDTGASTQGRIRIGAMDTVIHTWLSPLVARVTETFPAVEIELMADTARNLSEQLQKGYLDLIFQTDSLRHESVLNLELGSYPLRWIVSTGSIYHRDYASLADLARERVVTFSKHSRPHQDVLGLLHANGVAAPRLNCVNSVAAMTRLLRDGFGVGALPPALVSQELERGELTLLRLGPPPPNLPVVVSWRGGTGLELVDEVVELSKAVLADYAANVGPECMLLAPLKKGGGCVRADSDFPIAPGGKISLDADRRPLLQTCQQRRPPAHGAAMPEPTFHELAQLPPPVLRQLIRRGDYAGHTSGLGQRHLQANLVILQKSWADEFLRFCALNPGPARCSTSANPARRTSPGSARISTCAATCRATGCIGAARSPSR